MSKIHNRQFDDTIIGGQFAAGNLYLTKANGVTVIVSPGQTQTVNNYPMNQISVGQNSETIVSGEFQGTTLVLTKSNGDTVEIAGGVPDLTTPPMVGQSVHFEQNCESIVGGSIDGSTITLFKYCGDTIVINGYSDSYPDSVGYDIVTTTTTEGPTTTTTTTLNPIDPTTTTTTTEPVNITTTTTSAGQTFNQILNWNVFKENGVEVFRASDYIFDESGLYCALVDWMDVVDPAQNQHTSNGNALKYYGDFQVGTQTYSYGGYIQTFDGFRVMRIQNSDTYNFSDYLIVEFSQGVIQKIINVGTMVYTYADGTVQGEINTNNSLYGTCS